MKEKCLVSFCSYDAPWFLETLMDSLTRYDAGYSFDILILNHSSTNPLQLKLLEKYSKNHRVETRPNLGRAQGGYDYAWQNNKDYKYYFFLHDDSVILRDNWLKIAIERVNDLTIESQLQSLDYAQLPVGKVGFQGYEWQNKYQYLRTGYRTVFHYMDEVADILNVKIPSHYQHLNDDRLLYTNECLQQIGNIYNCQYFKDRENSKEFQLITQFFERRNLVNTTPFPPYTYLYHAFQTVSEFLNDINAMRYGFRTHVVNGPGYCQEELAFNSFWGNEYVAHFGDHVVFKGLSRVFNIDEDSIRNKFKDKTFLKICSNAIRKETTYVER